MRPLYLKLAACFAVVSGVILQAAQAPARDLIEGRDTTDDGVWRRHLLAETAEKLET